MNDMILQDVIHIYYHRHDHEAQQGKGQQPQPQRGDEEKEEGNGEDLLFIQARQHFERETLKATFGRWIRRTRFAMAEGAAAREHNERLKRIRELQERAQKQQQRASAGVGRRRLRGGVGKGGGGSPPPPPRAAAQAPDQRKPPVAWREVQEKRRREAKDRRREEEAVAERNRLEREEEELRSIQRQKQEHQQEAMQREKDRQHALQTAREMWRGAVEHHRKAVLFYSGFLPWRRRMERRAIDHVKAARFAAYCSLSRHFVAWDFVRCQRAAAAKRRFEARLTHAREHFSRRLLGAVWRVWKSRRGVVEERAAVISARVVLGVLARCLDTWRVDAMPRALERSRHQQEQADGQRITALLRRGLRGWREGVNKSRLDSHAEAEWNRVRSWLGE